MINSLTKAQLEIIADAMEKYEAPFPARMSNKKREEYIIFLENRREILKRVHIALRDK